MQFNPYESPAPGGAPPPGQDQGRRTAFVLAAIGAGLASLYWAAHTLLVGVAIAAGGVSGAQLILPCVLIGLYALRAFQIWKGDAAAARGVLWLHGIGGVMALLQMFSGSSFLIVLHGIKVAIHVFGGITALRASRS